MTQRLTVLALDTADLSGWALLILDPEADARLLASGKASTARERQRVAEQFADLLRGRGGAALVAAETWTNKRTHGAMIKGKKTGKLGTKTLIGLGASFGCWRQAYEIAFDDRRLDLPKVIRWTPPEWRDVIGATTASGEVAKAKAVEAATDWWGVEAGLDEAEAIAIGTRALTLPPEVRAKLGVRACAGLDPFDARRASMSPAGPPELPPILPPILPPRPLPGTTTT